MENDKPNVRTIMPGGHTGTGLIISIKEARKVLGVESHNLSDDEIIKLIASFTKIASSLLLGSI